MRLLEFNRDEGGANPQQAMRNQAAGKTAAAPAERPRKVIPPARETPPRRPAKVFQVKTSTTRKPAPRSPIDLEQLQQRISVLERRIQARLEQSRQNPPARELELLKQRMRLLERKLDDQIWLASQREHTMLEMLSRPTPKQLIRQKLVQLRRRQLPAVGRWLRSAAGEWWTDNQPRWWPELARAWQESLEKARR